MVRDDMRTGVAKVVIGAVTAPMADCQSWEAYALKTRSCCEHQREHDVAP